MSAIDPAIASLLAAKQSAVQSKITFALAEKSLSATRQQGDAIAKLINDAGRLGMVQGRGAQLDTIV